MPEQAPSPALFFETITAHQRTAVLKAALELDVFTAIAEGHSTAQALAQRCQAAQRGLRILCDYLCVVGFLSKEGAVYGLTPESAIFLNRNAPTYLGGAVAFLLSPKLMEGFNDIAAAVRNGGTILPEDGTVTPEHAIWVAFAQAMAPMATRPAKLIAELVDPQRARPLKVLDIAAGHGVYGIALAQHNPAAEVIALDWPNVLAVAQANAQAAGVEHRYGLLAGSAFEVDFGQGYDLVLLTNFLHHFDAATCERLASKVYAALAQGGRAVTLEFVPNEDRISPPESATFSMIMLASTPRGDAYTFSELEGMFRQAGFTRSDFHRLPPPFQQVVVSYK